MIFGHLSNGPAMAALCGPLGGHSLSAEAAGPSPTADAVKRKVARGMVDCS
jgi:hypothetical protein